jgi:hypothetical protein
MRSASAPAGSVRLTAGTMPCAANTGGRPRRPSRYTAPGERSRAALASSLIRLDRSPPSAPVAPARCGERALSSSRVLLWHATLAVTDGAFQDGQRPAAGRRRSRGTRLSRIGRDVVDVFAAGDTRSGVRRTAGVLQAQRADGCVMQQSGWRSAAAKTAAPPPDDPCRSSVGAALRFLPCSDDAEVREKRSTHR